MNKLVTGTLVLAGAVMATPVTAQNSDQYLGTVFPTGANFCPRGTLSASGQVLPIAQYTAVFALLGTNYGGDGRTTFGLPDLRSRAPIGQGQGPGLTSFREGDLVGRETVTLQESQLPFHTHGSPRVSVRAQGGDTTNPAGNTLASGSYKIFVGPASTQQADNTFARAGTVQVNPAGNGQPLPILEPSLAVTYCIVMEGIFPTRN